MPIYEYKCKKCKEIFEDFVEIGTKEKECPRCGKTCKKIMSTACWSLKGEGWYGVTNPSN